MKKRVIAVLGILLLSSALVFGCFGKNDTQDTDAKEQVEETDQKEDVDTESSSEADAGIEDGTYSADFNTDSGMFHANEACEGKGTLTVKDGKLQFKQGKGSMKQEKAPVKRGRPKKVK